MLKFYYFHFLLMFDNICLSYKICYGKDWQTHMWSYLWAWQLRTWQKNTTYLGKIVTNTLFSLRLGGRKASKCFLHPKKINVTYIYLLITSLSVLIKNYYCSYKCRVFKLLFVTKLLYFFCIANESGVFKDEIVPITLKGKKGIFF